MNIIAEYEYFVLMLYRLCPELIQIPLNFDKYTAKAQEVREILVEYDPRFESASIDEAVGPFPACCFATLKEPGFWNICGKLILICL